MAAALSCSAVALAQHAPSPSVDPLPLPSGVTNVSPRQGFIDVSPNANPLGVGQISVYFRDAPIVNSSCTEVAQCWFNGEEAPIATATVANANVDAMGEPVGAVRFTQNLTAAGTYHVSIPAGFWLVNSAPSPAIELNYEIFDLYNISPVAGLVDDLSEITIIFPEADEVKISRSDLEFFKQGTSEFYSLSYKVMESEPGGPKNKVVFTFLDENGEVRIPKITAAGAYNFHAVEGAFTAIVHGPNFLQDPTDYTEWTSPEIVMIYQISPFPAPTITPEPGQIDKFEKFTLKMPEGFELFFTDNMAKSYIYPVLPDGSRSPDAVCALICTRDFNVADEAILDVRAANGAMLEDGYVPEPGTYALVLANALLSGMYNGEFVSAGGFTYIYTVSSTVGVNGVQVSELKPLGIHTLNGMKVNSDPENLPKGLYIIDGKKVIVK